MGRSTSWSLNFLARRFTTLDHLTRGRVGWNVVTGYLESAAANLGLGAQLPHDERYAQADEYLEALQRERAEFSNFRRRTGEEREQWLGLASESLIRKVLAIADDFDRAIEAMPPELAGNPWAQGVAAIDRKLRQLLESEGVSPLESVGKPFDPREHEAISNVPDTGRPVGEVVAELQRGYKLRDRVLRPALVAVASDGDGSGPSGSPGGEPGEAHENQKQSRSEHSARDQEQE